MVIVGLQSFSFVTSAACLGNVRYEPISTNYLHKHVDEFTQCMEKNIDNLLPARFLVIFDGDLLV